MKKAFPLAIMCCIAIVLFGSISTIFVSRSVEMLPAGGLPLFVTV